MVGVDFTVIGRRELKISFIFAKADVNGDPDATTLLERIELRVFVPIPRETQVSRRSFA